MYELIKNVHILLAALTGLGLLARIGLVATESPHLQNKLVVLGFMAIDISLVALGVVLAIMIPKEALANGWLLAKVVAWFFMFGAVFYGVKIAQQKTIRIAATSVGFLLFLYIMAVAKQHAPLPF